MSFVVKTLCLHLSNNENKKHYVLALLKMHISIDFPVLDSFPAAESI